MVRKPQDEFPTRQNVCRQRTLPVHHPVNVCQLHAGTILCRHYRTREDEHLRLFRDYQCRLEAVDCLFIARRFIRQTHIICGLNVGG